MTKKAADSPTISFRCSPEEYARIADAAKGRGVSPGLFIRNLALAEISGEFPGTVERGADPPLATKAEVERLVRRAVWAIIVALSAEIDEEEAERYCAEVFDA